MQQPLTGTYSLFISGQEVKVSLNQNEEAASRLDTLRSQQKAEDAVVSSSG